MITPSLVQIAVINQAGQMSSALPGPNFAGTMATPNAHTLQAASQSTFARWQYQPHPGKTQCEQALVMIIYLPSLKTSPARCGKKVHKRLGQNKQP